MIIIKEPININNIVEMASNRYGDMVKAVADVEDVQIQKAIIAITNKYILR
jgi:hypothetical protein